MSIVSFLHDLGIIPNENTGLENDQNLLQGQNYMEFGRVYAGAAKPHLKLLEITTSPNINSIVETFDDNDSIVSNKKTHNVSMSDIEKEFNRTLSQYTTSYKNFTSNSLNNNLSKKEIQTYFKNLQRLNDKLISLAKAMGKDLDSVLLTDNNIKIKLDKQQHKLNTYISALNKDRTNISNVNKSYNTISGEQVNSELRLVSNQYNYIVWFILAITIISIVINITLSETITDTMSSNTGNILLIVSLIALFLIVKNLYIIYR